MVVIAFLFWFFNRKSSFRVKMRWLLILWVILVAGELTKQIYYIAVNNWIGRIPINFSATTLYIMPFILFSKKHRKIYKVAWHLEYVVSSCIAVVTLIYPALLAGDLPTDGNVFVSMQVAWSVIYHLIVLLIGLILLTFHPFATFEWKYLFWTIVFVVAWLLLMIILSLLMKNNLGMIVEGSFVSSLTLWPHILVMSTVYLAGGVLSFMIWKFGLIRIRGLDNVLPKFHQNSILL